MWFHAMPDLLPPQSIRGRLLVNVAGPHHRSADKLVGGRETAVFVQQGIQ